MNELVIFTLGSFCSLLGLSYFYYKISEASIKVNLKVVLSLIYGTLLSAIVKHYNVTFVNITSYFFVMPILFYNLKPLPIKKFTLYLIII